MNAIQSKQVLAIAQEAIAMLPHELTLALRVRLEQAIASPVKQGTVKLPNGKAVIDDLADPFSFKEKKGASSYASYWFGKSLGPQNCAIEMPRGLAESFTKIEVSTEDRDRQITNLGLCACGHPAHQHEKDDLENLLECLVFESAFEDAKKCACDHFHYDVDSEAA